MASAVVARAEAHTVAAKGIAQASERQAEALREANGLLPSVAAAVEEALGAVRYVAVRLGVGCTCSQDVPAPAVERAVSSGKAGDKMVRSKEKPLTFACCT